jgi:Putative zinc-finger
MTKRFACEDKDQLVGWLYGETSDEDRAGLEAHIAMCAACAGELDALRRVRVSLSAWQPPDADLGFRIVREPVTQPRRWWQVPAWASAAMAAALLLAVGAALSQVQLEYGNGTVVVRTAWSDRARGESAAAPAIVPASASVAGANLSADEVRAAMADLEKRLRAEMATSRPTPQATPVAAGARVDRGDLLRRVETLIAASEQRQQRELALRLSQVMRDVETQRRADLVRIEQGMGEIEGLTGREAERMINYLMRTSVQR